MTKYTPPEEVNTFSLAISYQLPSNIEEKLSQDELRCFYSWSEAQQRLFLKQARVISSVSGTAATANKLARIGLNRQAPKHRRPRRLDALGELIFGILEDNLNAHWTDVLVRLEELARLDVPAPMRVICSMKGQIKWKTRGGKDRFTPFDAIEDRVSRIKRILTHLAG
jgi:hypothetical protein